MTTLSTLGPTKFEKPRNIALGAALSKIPALIKAEDYQPPKDHPQTLSEAILRLGTSANEIVAYRADGSVDRLEYAPLLRRAQLLSAGLKAKGMRKGDILLCDVADPITCVIAMWGAILAGMIPAPIDVPHANSPPDAFGRLRTAAEVLGNPALLTANRAPDTSIEGLATYDIDALCDAKNAPQIPASVAPEDIAVILLTSGSTGRPKAVLQSHRAVLAMVGSALQTSCGVTSSDPVFNWMPRDHVGSVMFATLGAAVTGASQIHAETAAILADPAQWLEIASAERAALTWSPNFSFALIAKAARAAPKEWDLSNMRAIFNGGEAVTEDTLRDFCAAIAPYKFGGQHVIIPSLGMSETCSAVTIGRLGAPHGPYTSLGPAVPGSSIRILGETGALLCEGEIGRIEVAGPQLLSGYLGLEQAVKDGWYDTGDLGFIANNELYLTGRLKDTVNVNGASYFVHELETALAGVQGLNRNAFAATPLQSKGATTERMGVFFSTDPDDGIDDPVALASVGRAIRFRLGNRLSLAPDILVPVTPDEIPRTNIGKVSRRTLQSRFDEGAHDTAVQRIDKAMGTAGFDPVAVHMRCWQPAAPATVPNPDADITVYATAADAGILGARNRVILIDDDLAADAIPKLPSDVSDQTILMLAPLSNRGTPAELSAYTALTRLGTAITALPTAQRPARVLVVTGGSLATSHADTVVPGHALLAGLVRSFAAALPEVKWCLADIPRDCIGQEYQRILGTTEPVSAYRNGAWQAPRWRAEDLLEPQTHCDQTWIVTGGLGGIGRAACAELLHNNGAAIIIGRTPESDLDATKTASLQALRAAGPVAYIASDLAAPDIAAKITAAAQKMGRKVTGLLHLAANLPKEDSGAETSQDGFAREWAQALAAQDMIFRLASIWPKLRLVLVGSITGQLGSPLLKYAAMNAALAERAQGTLGAAIDVSYMNLSCWEERGMSRGRTNRSLLHAGGLLTLTDKAGLALLTHAKHAGAGLRIGGLDTRHPRHGWMIQGQAAMPVLRACVWTENQDAVGALPLQGQSLPAHWAPLRSVGQIPFKADGTVDYQQLTSATAIAPEAENDPVAQIVALAMAEVLDMPGIHVSSDFFAMGGSSLQATQLTHRIFELLFTKLSIAGIFRAPYPAQLAQHLRECEAEPGLVDAAAHAILDLISQKAG
ncbi:MAG: AMP-binding protein [Sulfitobacter sp.]